MLHYVESLAAQLSRSYSDEEITGLIHSEIEDSDEFASVDDARTVDGAVPVWAIVGHLQAVQGDIEQATIDYAISTDAVRAAVLYYFQNRERVNGRILANVDETSTFAAH